MIGAFHLRWRIKYTAILQESKYSSCFSYVNFRWIPRYAKYWTTNSSKTIGNLRELHSFGISSAPINDRLIPFIQINVLAVLFNRLSHLFKVVGRDQANKTKQRFSWYTLRRRESLCVLKHLALLVRIEAIKLIEYLLFERDVNHFALPHQLIGVDLCPLQPPAVVHVDRLPFGERVERGLPGLAHGVARAARSAEGELNLSACRAVIDVHDPGGQVADGPGCGVYVLRKDAARQAVLDTVVDLDRFFKRRHFDN